MPVQTYPAGHESQAEVVALNEVPAGQVDVQGFGEMYPLTEVVLTGQTESLQSPMTLTTC